MNHCGELGELANVCYPCNCLLFQLLFTNGSEVANAAYSMTLVVHFKGQSRSWGTFSPTGNGVFTDDFNGAQKPYTIEVATSTSTCLLVQWNLSYPDLSYPDPTYPDSQLTELWK